MTSEQVIAFIKETQIGYLATVDSGNTPRVRPIGIDTVYDGEVYFFTFNNTRKVAEITANPQVEIAWSNSKNLTQVRLSGKSITVEDEAIIQRFKDDNPIVAQILPPGAEHLFHLYKIKPDKVEVAEGLVPYKEVSL